MAANRQIPFPLLVVQGQIPTWTAFHLGPLEYLILHFPISPLESKTNGHMLALIPQGSLIVSSQLEAKTSPGQSS